MDAFFQSGQLAGPGQVAGTARGGQPRGPARYAAYTGAVMRTIHLRGRELTGAALRAELPRAEVDIDGATHRVAPILADVGARGAGARGDHAEKSDGEGPPGRRS